MGVSYSEGKYNVRCLEMAFTETKSGKKPMIATKVLVLDSIDDEGNQAPVSKNWERTIYTVIDESNSDQMDYSVAKIRGTGWQGIRFEDFPKYLIGKEFPARCYHTENKQDGSKYFGETQENWDFWLPKKESRPLESIPAVAKQLNAVLSKRLKETATAAPAPVKTTKDQGDSAGIPDDEVPF